MNPNKIYLMDNLTFLLKLPQEYFDLVYIDPPFYSQKHHDDFNDKWESLGEYLDFINVRLKEIHRVLKSTGSLYVHLDYHASHYIKILLDKIFGCENFRNEIVWKRSNSHALRTSSYDNVIDSILFYTKTNEYFFRRLTEKLPANDIKRRYPKIEKETGKRYRLAPVESSSNASNKNEIRIYNGKKFKTNLGWKWSQQTLNKRLKNNPNLIVVSNKKRLNYKLYYKDGKRYYSNLWISIPKNTGMNIDYATQKPEKLLERIIQASSREGDMVGDFFLGSGTTCAVAKRLRRQWMGCDHNPEAIKKAKERLKRVKVYANILDFSRPNEESEEERDEKLTRWLS